MVIVGGVLLGRARFLEDEVGIEEPSAHNTGLRGSYGRGKLRGGRRCCAVSGLEIFVRLLFLIWHLWRDVHVVRLRLGTFGDLRNGRGRCRYHHFLVASSRNGTVTLGVGFIPGMLAVLVAHVLVFGETGRGGGVGGRVAHVLLVGETGRGGGVGGSVAQVLVFGETGRGGWVGGRVAHVLVFGETGRGGGVGGRVAHVLVFGETGRGGGVGGRVAHVLVFGETGRGRGVGGRVGGRGWGRVGTGEQGSRQLKWRVRDVIHFGRRQCPAPL